MHWNIANPLRFDDSFHPRLFVTSKEVRRTPNAKSRNMGRRYIYSKVSTSTLITCLMHQADPTLEGCFRWWRNRVSSRPECRLPKAPPTVAAAVDDDVVLLPSPKLCWVGNVDTVEELCVKCQAKAPAAPPKTNIAIIQIMSLNFHVLRNSLDSHGSLRFSSGECSFSHSASFATILNRLQKSA